MDHASRFKEILAEVEGWESPRVARKKEIARLEVQQLREGASPVMAAAIAATADPNTAIEKMASLRGFIDNSKLAPEQVLVSEELWEDILALGQDLKDVPIRECGCRVDSPHTCLPPVYDGPDGNM